MAEFPALSIWTDAYLADTRHLSTLEHGAYLLLLMEAWRRKDCALPDDDELLSRLSGVPGDTWGHTKKTVMAFWALEDGYWTQKRLLRERRYVTDKRSKAAAAGRARALKYKDKVPADAAPKLSLEPAPTPTPTPIKKEYPPAPSGAAPPASDGPIDLTLPASLKRRSKGKTDATRRGTRLDDAWQPGDADREYAQGRGFTASQIDDIAASFHTYWTAGAGRNKTHARWDLAWQRWVDKETPRAGTGGKLHVVGGNRPGPAGVVAAVSGIIDRDRLQ